MFVVVGAVCVWEFAYSEGQLVEWAAMAVLDLSMLAGKPHASSASGKMLALVTFPWCSGLFGYNATYLGPCLVEEKNRWKGDYLAL